jgi:hypothetical protein
MRYGIDELLQSALSLEGQAAKAYDAGVMKGADGFHMLRMKADNLWDIISYRASIGAYLAQA